MKKEIKKENMGKSLKDKSKTISIPEKLEAKIYNKEGKEAGILNLPNKIFSVKWKADLVHQVVEGMRSNRRINIAHAKDRSEVRGGGKKPWKQKGTGRARHGSSRSPIWVGGGVAHGPLKEKNYKKKISRKMKKSALFCVLSKKLKEKEILFVDSLILDKIKTKEGEKIVINLAKILGAKNYKEAKNPKFLISLFNKNENTKKSLNNIPFINLAYVENLNPLDILNHKYLLIENGEKYIDFLSRK